MAGWAHTYFPNSGAFVSGEQEAYVPGMPVLAMAKQAAPELDAQGRIIKAGAWTTTNLSASVQKAGRFIKKLKQQYGNLAAADENVVGDFLAPLIQVRLHEQIMGEQQRWFHLANAFTSMTVDKLLYRMPFQDSPAAAQKVAAREQYDVNKITYHEQFLELEKAVNSYDIAWEDKLRATIDFEPTLSNNLNFSIDYLREVDAIAEIKKLGTDGATVGTATNGYYNVDTGKFVNSAPSAATAKLTPHLLEANTPHSKQRSVDLVMESMNKFTEENDMFIDTVVANPQVVMRLAANTWTENNTIFNVEAYRTNGGVRQFPGIPGVQVVMSLLVPKDAMYCYAKNMDTFMLAEGPKQFKMWDDPTRFRKIHAQADFYKHQYMLEDISYEEIKRRFGYVISVDLTAT